MLMCVLIVTCRCQLNLIDASELVNTVTQGAGSPGSSVVSGLSSTSSLVEQERFHNGTEKVKNYYIAFQYQIISMIP